MCHFKFETAGHIQTFTNFFSSSLLNGPNKPEPTRGSLALPANITISWKGRQDIQHNDTQHNRLNCDFQHKWHSGMIVSSAECRYAEYLVFYCWAECQYTKYPNAEYHYAEFRYGVCRYAELHCALERLARNRHSNLFDPLVSCEKNVMQVQHQYYKIYDCNK